MNGLGNFFASENNGNQQGGQGQQQQSQGDALNQGQQQQAQTQTGQDTQGQATQQQQPTVSQEEFNKVQNELQQTRQWQEDFKRFMTGGAVAQGQQSNQQVNAQLHQLLQNDPAALFNTYGQQSVEQSRSEAQKAVNEALAVNQAVSHFNSNYPQYANFGSEVELQVMQVSNELQQQQKAGKQVSMTPAQLVDEGVRRFESKMAQLQGGQNQPYSVGNPRQVSALDVGSVSNPIMPMAQQQQSQVNWAGMSSQEFEAAKRQALSNSYAY